MLKKTNITKDTADVLLTKWVTENRQVQFFSFHGEKPALVTFCEGVLIVSRPGIFMHRSKNASNFLNTELFQEFFQTESEDCVILRLKCLSDAKHAGLNVMLSIQESDDLGDLLLITDSIQ
jgi:hypothetical protein